MSRIVPVHPMAIPHATLKSETGQIGKNTNESTNLALGIYASKPISKPQVALMLAGGGWVEMIV